MNETVKYMKKTIIIILSVSLIIGCSNRKNNSREASTAEVLVGVGILAVLAIPMTPASIVYHSLINTSGKKEKRIEELRLLVEPIYLKRIEILESLDANEDAKSIYAESGRILLPASINSSIDHFKNLYPGADEFDFKIDAEKNISKLTKNANAFKVLNLLEKDPLHQESGLHFSSSILTEFHDESRKYRNQFNKAMVILSRKDIPECSVDLIPTEVVSPIYPTSPQAPVEKNGFVLMEFTVDESGKTLHQRVLESSNIRFNRSALEAITKFKFPATNHKCIHKYKISYVME